MIKKGTLFPSFCSMLYKDALCAQGTGEDGVDADFHLIDFSLECLLVLFKASVASWLLCTLSSYWQWEGEKQDEDSFFPCPSGQRHGLAFCLCATGFRRQPSLWLSDVKEWGQM